MKKTTQRLLIALLGIPLLACARPVQADSIWDRREQRSAFLYVDSRARKIGDVLTVVVREATDIDNKEKRALNKASQSKYSFLTKGNSSGSILPTKDLSAEFNASGDASRKFVGSPGTELEFAL